MSCWGDNSKGELGNGIELDASGNGNNSLGGPYEYAPVAASGREHTTQLAAGVWFTCARHTTGTVSCWGRTKSAS